VSAVRLTPLFIFPFESLNSVPPTRPEIATASPIFKKASAVSASLLNKFIGNSVTSFCPAFSAVRLYVLISSTSLIHSLLDLAVARSISETFPNKVRLQIPVIFVWLVDALGWDLSLSKYFGSTEVDPYLSRRGFFVLV
jgi:hypothetical protein